MKLIYICCFSISAIAEILLLPHLENKSSSGDEISERDVTYHPLCLLIYH